VQPLGRLLVHAMSYIDGQERGVGRAILCNIRVSISQDCWLEHPTATAVVEEFSFVEVGGLAWCLQIQSHQLTATIPQRLRRVVGRGHTEAFGEDTAQHLGVQAAS
jgi:hypothetical protein